MSKSRASLLHIGKSLEGHDSTSMKVARSSRLPRNKSSESHDEAGNTDGIVLKDLNVSIKPGQKVALCGRSGR